MKRSFKGTSRLHMGLNTNQLDKSIEFYEALFNMKASKVKPGYAKFEVEEPPVNLTLSEARQVAGNPINHLGIEVKFPGNVREQHHRLKKLGLETFLEENTSCCYAKQDKVWVTDPNGNSWETFVALEESEDRSDPGSDAACCVESEATAKSCC